MSGSADHARPPAWCSSPACPAAARSSILHALEDLGYEAVDNPPLGTRRGLMARERAAAAIGMDARTRGFDAGDGARHDGPAAGRRAAARTGLCLGRRERAAPPLHGNPAAASAGAAGRVTRRDSRLEERLTAELREAAD